MTKNKIKSALIFLLAQAKELKCVHAGGPYEQTYDSLLKEAQEVVKIFKRKI